MENIHIRKLTDEDPIPMELLLLADPEEEIVRDYLNRGECIIAQENNQTVGEMVIMATRPHTAEIMNIAVEPSCQNRGIAKKLIAFGKERAKELGYTTLEIGTGNPGLIQMMLYQKCGFRIVGVDLDFFRRNYKERIFENGLECRDMIRMQMEL